MKLLGAYGKVSQAGAGVICLPPSHLFNPPSASSCGWAPLLWFCEQIPPFRDGNIGGKPGKSRVRYLQLVEKMYYRELPCRTNGIEKLYSRTVEA